MLKYIGGKGWKKRRTEAGREKKKKKKKEEGIKNTVARRCKLCCKYFLLLVVVVVKKVDIYEIYDKKLNNVFFSGYGFIGIKNNKWKQEYASWFGIHFPEFTHG